MDTVLLQSFESIFSAPRIQRYKTATSSDLDASVSYLWNIQLGQALFPSLAVFEVSLRNAVHNALTAHYQTDWWFKPGLHHEMFMNVTSDAASIMRRSGQPPSIGKLISEITFGFWPKIFAKRYNDLWWSRPSPLLGQVLPNHPRLGRDTRVRLEERLEYFVQMRNRIMHHEAIFQGVGALNRPVLPLNDLHDQLIETIGWISADAHRAIQLIDTFDNVFDPNWRTALEADVKREFHIP